MKKCLRNWLIFSIILIFVNIVFSFISGKNFFDSSFSVDYLLTAIAWPIAVNGITNLCLYFFHRNRD